MTNYAEMGVGKRIVVDTIAESLIEKVASEAEFKGSPLSISDIWVLRHPIYGFTEAFRNEVEELHNRCVELVRTYVLRTVSSGESCIGVRPDLWVPTDFEKEYEVLFDSNHPWFICLVIQAAFLGNPLVGEVGEWSPNNAPRSARIAN